MTKFLAALFLLCTMNAFGVDRGYHYNCFEKGKEHNQRPETLFWSKKLVLSTLGNGDRVRTIQTENSYSYFNKEKKIYLTTSDEFGKEKITLLVGVKDKYVTYVCFHAHKQETN